jgi:hypothetical protein
MPIVWREAARVVFVENLRLEPSRLQPCQQVLARVIAEVERRAALYIDSSAIVSMEEPTTCALWEGGVIGARQAAGN